MAKDPNESDSKLDAGERVDRELSRSLSFLWGACRATGAGGVYALYIRLKTGGIYVAVAKRNRTQDHFPMVAFGQGRTIGKALQALNSSMQQDKWKRDMPYEGSR